MLNKLKKGFFAFWVVNYKVSFLVIALIIISGIFSLFSIPKESSPDIKFGIISISTIYPGVNPTDIDSLITEKIEKEIKDIDGIKKMNSSSSVGISSIIVELYNGVDSNDVMIDIKDKVDSLSFPEDAEDPFVTEISTESNLMFEALVYGPREKFSDFFLINKTKQLKNNLEGNSGISSIDIGGIDSLQFSSPGSNESDYDIKVLISKEKLELLGLSLNQISSIIRSYNKNTPIGNYKIGDLKYDFRFKGEFSSLEDLKNIIIRDDGLSKIKLGDIAEFKKEYDIGKYNSLGLYNEKGYNYVSLVFNKSPGSSVFSTSGEAKKALESYINSSPEFSGLKVLYTKDMSELIIDDYSNLGRTALQTLILVFITILFFVGFRESLIASLLLPLSFFITFTVLDTIGFSMNFLTNFSLVLTLGIAIDTIIVIIEGASERQKLGYSRVASILLAIRDLRSPLISGTLTTLSAFLPLIFLPGIMGRFLSYIPITVFSTLLAALILSLTVSSALFIKLTKKTKVFHREKSFESLMSEEEKELLEEDREGKIEIKNHSLSLRERFLSSIGDYYYKILKKFLNRKIDRIFSIILPIILLALSFFFLSPKIGFTIFPNTDNSVITANIEAEIGKDKDALIKYLPEIDDAISIHPELKVYYISVSGNTISIYIELLDKIKRQDLGMRSVFKVEKEISSELSRLTSLGLKVESDILKEGPPGVEPVGVKLIASDNKRLDSLKEVSGDFKDFLKTVQGTKNVKTSSSDNPGQFIFSFDREKLSYVGLSPNDILGELYAYTNGIKSGTIKSSYEDNDIILKVSEFDENLEPDDIMNMIINTKIGKIRVGDYVEYSFDKSLSSINREDGKITISVESGLQTGFLPSQVQPKLIDFAENYNYPTGISFSSGGENTENQDLIFSTIKSFFIAMFLIFGILVFQFNSFGQPIIILYSVVLALLGVNIGLFATGNPYSMPFAIGFIALTGVVVNDAIILVDRANRNLKRAVGIHGEKLSKQEFMEALIYAGKSRLQPIIVTTLTTVFGVLPLALQDPFWAGLGFTIIFGLFAGSAMTLFIIPSLYYTTRYGRYK